VSEAEDAARTVARAFARSAIYYRKTALIAGFIALGACISGVVLEATPSRVVVLAFAILFAIFTYRSMRAMRRYLDPKHSPVLDALAMSPVNIVEVAILKRGSDKRVEITARSGETLVLRPAIDDEDGAEALAKAFITVQNAAAAALKNQQT